MTRAAAILAWFLGIGFGVPAAIGLGYFVRHHLVWTFLGFPTYGGGPFERWGLPTGALLLTGFVAVCAAELAIGFPLWSDRTAGLWLALAILPFELFYWIGFALPVGPVLGAVRTVLVVIALFRR